MKTALLALTSLALLASCSCSSKYCIRTKDGRRLVCASPPELQSKTGYYRYRCPLGRDGVVLSSDVVSIEKSS
jgi:hypothetical protein